jgi:hypothetical protein
MQVPLRGAALEVLSNNDLGGWTKPAPRLYPHQWSWDSAFIAIGLAHVDPDRALRELETLFEAQWSDGRVPHIVFNPTAPDYFPGPEWWASAATSPHAPRERATSGLIQPPVHALALAHVVALTHDGELRERIRALAPRVVAWHRYLAVQRDPGQRGLLVIYHPWESGTDNSPRWDTTLARIEPGPLPPFQRHDLKVVGDPAERPTQLDYERYMWLVELLKQCEYEDACIQREHPFRVRDVLMSAVFAAACGALASVSPADADEMRAYAERFTAGVVSAWDDRLRLALDYDDVAQRAVDVQTCAGLAPLLLPAVDTPLLDALVARIEGVDFAGAPDFKHAVVPSTAARAQGFHPRAYWRGPAWPVFNWLVWWGLRQHGRLEAADRLRSANLDLLAEPGAEFAEYFEPYTSEPLGSKQQSWTAAVALDWLSTPS